MLFYKYMGTLFVVATPIGNLKDITSRALEILQNVNLIACEDTRVTKILLNHYQIDTNCISYHQHSNHGKIDFLIERLKAGEDIALVTDAGTPGISDPGGLLAQAAWREGIKVEPIPGASAITAALSISGLPTDRFLFLGFLPQKKGRQTILKEIVDSKITVVFYESVYRIIKALEQLVELNLDREVVVCRELTKKFETINRGMPKEVLEKVKADQNKGEFVVIISPNKYLFKKDK